jgi:hypothetical protein
MDNHSPVEDLIQEKVPTFHPTDLSCSHYRAPEAVRANWSR